MIKVGILISYDYKYAFTCIKQIYDAVDEIYLAIDENYKTWNGATIEIPESFFTSLKEFDYKRKVIIYKDNFYVPNLSTMENETRERELLAKRMGKGWICQIDADEYVYDFEILQKFLLQNKYISKIGKTYPITYTGNLITLFRKLNNGYLYIENNEQVPFVSNTPEYTKARNNLKSRYIKTNINIIHQSWAREETEILTKIKNWGHNTDFDVDEFFRFWQNINEENYIQFKNFHPLTASTWNELKYIEAKDIEEFIEKYAQKNPQRTPIYFSKTDKYKLILKDWLGKKSN